MGAYNIVGASSLVAGQPEDVSQVLANFQAIATILNGGIDNSNINAAAAIAASKLSGYPTDVSKVLAGDGTWKAVPKTTVSALSGGPPGSPSDGDIWIATGVDTAGTRWHFQYNAGSASSYKWEFIGGGHVSVRQSADLATTVINTWLLSDGTYTVARAGDYLMSLIGHTSIDTTFNALVYMGVRGTGLGADLYTDPQIIRTAGDEVQAAFDLGPVTLPSNGVTLTLMGQASAKSAANYPHYRNMRLRIVPIRVS